LGVSLLAPLTRLDRAGGEENDARAQEVQVSLSGTTRLTDDGAFAKLEETLRRPGVASELFFPVEHAAHRNGRLWAPPSKTRSIRSTAGGVRLHAADLSDRSRPTHDDCQHDVVRLVEALRMIRRDPALGGVVLSDHSVPTAQLGNRAGRRVKFGLYVPPGDRFRDERAAARESHKQICRAIRRAGFIVDQPAERFDPRSGLEGLSNWGSRLRLRRRRSDLPLILAAFLLAPLLALLLPGCPRQEILNLPIKGDLILVLDQSGSMTQYFPLIREEAKQYLKAQEGGLWRIPFADRFWHKPCVDCIKYDSKPESVLGELREVTQATTSRLEQFLDEAPGGGGTNLEPALAMAAEEVARHRHPTTLVILTDGEDGSIAGINSQIESWKARFGGVETHVHTITPRQLARGADKQPANTYEQELARLSEHLGGQFGPTMPRKDEENP
jgi:hypothetical protein